MNGISCVYEFYGFIGGTEVELHAFLALLPESKLIKGEFSKDLGPLLLLIGARGSAVGRGTALQAGRSRVQFPMVSLEFFIDIILSPAGVDSAPNRNDYQEYFMGVKAAGA
jgi:hypothetical protein